MPGTHAVQIVSPSYDTWPAGQIVHGELPEVFLYFPISHAVQLPAGPVYPGPHERIQLVAAALPGGDSVDDGHAEQLCSEELYVSAGHGSQSTTLLTTALYLPGSQATHRGWHALEFKLGGSC